MKNKKIINTLPAQLVDMGGIPIRQALPTQVVEQIDPFLLLHHGKMPITKGLPAKQQGVGPHPHRGFSPATFVIEGEVHHRDSLGNSSIISKGGVQWVNAGRGIIHSERPSDEIASSGNPMEIIQLWINVPASNKMDAAGYFAHQKDDLPELNLESGAKVNVVAGKIGDVHGKIPTKSAMNIGWIYAEKGQKVNLGVEPGHNFALYIVKGNGSISGFGLAEEMTLYHFDNEGDGFEFEASESSQLLYLSAEPLNEKLATYGPFVMNNQTEIMEAMRDYQMGKMGILIEE